MNALDRRADEDSNGDKEPEPCEPILIDKHADWIDVASPDIARTLRGRRGGS